ncbi:MAG: deoxyuridine 5'-triphosphate nucleotidohydrolase [Oscillospiraceae bacterium]|nr:deoxyuridine 5'-triphosphate nucleotidohydrolase [Candidatus Equicaccousia limihippi]
MQKVARFFKVSQKNFSGDINSVILPRRATVGSAGYDFFAPCDITFAAGETKKIETGVRAKIENGFALFIFPRSGLGFKYRLMLDNTVGIIDSDYYYSDNEGHIMIKMTNHSDKELTVKQGEAFAQGIFMPFYITEDDHADGVRNGGFGSTTK